MISSKTARLIILTALTMAGFSASATGLTKVFYSGYFTAYVPTPSLDEATFFHSDGPGIKFKDGRYFAGSLITRQRENLDPAFSLRDYPLYLFGLKGFEHLDAANAARFQRSHEELKESLADPVFDSIQIPGATVYTACSTRCEAIVVQDAQDEHLLHITSRGFNPGDITTLLEDGSDAAE